jgi:hypothetical protein
MEIRAAFCACFINTFTLSPSQGFFDPTAPLDFGDFDLNVLAEEAFHNPPAEPNFDGKLLLLNAPALQ